MTSEPGHALQAASERDATVTSEAGHAPQAASEHRKTTDVI
ncbi:MAG TPA: hypothetical protein VKP30_02325 [Polyangiaceae bacterium]|nr:hypothetical protein [Polyangiaceae bacterium]